mgnify:CR=1 FL=1
MMALSRKTKMDGDDETYRHGRKDRQSTGWMDRHSYPDKDGTMTLRLESDEKRTE